MRAAEKARPASTDIGEKSMDELKNAAAHTAALENRRLTPKTKPVKPGFLSTHKPGFTGLKIGGLPGFSGTWVPGFHSLVEA